MYCLGIFSYLSQTIMLILVITFLSPKSNSSLCLYLFEIKIKKVKMWKTGKFYFSTERPVLRDKELMVSREPSPVQCAVLTFRASSAATGNTTRASSRAIKHFWLSRNLFLEKSFPCTTRLVDHHTSLECQELDILLEIF